MKHTLAIACALSLVACSFQQADENPALKTNSCTADAECGAGEQCMSGLCVAPATDGMLDIALQVTPLPKADSEAPLPVLLQGLSLKIGQLDRRVELPVPLSVSGRIRNGGAAIDAALSFIPARGLSGIPSASVTASTTPATSNADIDYTVQLSGGVDYRVLVRPVDASLPPYHGEFSPSAGSDLSIDFAEIETRAQTYEIIAPADRTLLVRALDIKTDEPISSTATIADGKASLVFGMDPVPYRLEIYAEQSYDPSAQTAPTEGSFCDEDTPVYPIYSIADGDLPAKDRLGVIKVELPKVPARIRYEGTVALCGAGQKGAVPTELPVTLHSTELLVPDGSPFSASFDAKTSAQLDTTTGELRFCVQLLEGQYDVVVTPPTSMACAIYAEHRLVKAPDGKAASGVLLALPEAAFLQGTVRTNDLTPVAGATVDAIALGRATGIDLPENDMTLTRYNRSRQAVTGADGTFSIPVDLGSYDLQTKATASSGFSWQVQHNVKVGARRPFSTIVNMFSPVTFSGRLAYPNDRDKPQAALAGAEVLAYAVTREETVPKTGEFTETEEHATAIGKVMADSNGAFMLLLPQSIKPEF